MYLYPGSITGELLSLMAAETRMCPYFDVPFQHSAPSLLRAMYRSPDTRATWRLLDNIRTTVPYAAIRTTFITGFPGETSAHFRHLARFVERARFDKLGVFPYSPEEGTKAYTLGGRVRDSTAMRRCEALLEMQRDISREICESHVGRTVPVIIDRRVPGNSSGRFEGRTQWDAPEIDGVVHVRARTGTLVDGDIVDARICSAGDYDLFARTG
jgi:ribosomal protein S12 methylthiotransferase